MGKKNTTEYKSKFDSVKKKKKHDTQKQNNVNKSRWGNTYYT